MFEKFTDRARRVMALANQEAQRFNHEYIGTEHILLGLVKIGEGIGPNVIRNFDIDIRKVRLEVEKLVRSGPSTVTIGRLPQTPRTQKVIELSINEARELGDSHVGTEHLLLGLLAERDGVASQVLLNLGMGLDETREEIRNMTRKEETKKTGRPVFTIEFDAITLLDEYFGAEDKTTADDLLVAKAWRVIKEEIL